MGHCIAPPWQEADLWNVHKTYTLVTAVVGLTVVGATHNTRTGRYTVYYCIAENRTTHFQNNEDTPHFRETIF